MLTIRQGGTDLHRFLVLRWVACYRFDSVKCHIIFFCVDIYMAT